MRDNEHDMIRRAVQARTARRQLAEIKLAAEEGQALPVRIVAQHDWSRKQAAAAILTANAVVQVLVRVFL